MPLTRNDTIRRGSSHVEADAAEETLMLSIGRGTYYSVNDTARVIWKMLDGNQPIDELIASLALEYEVAPDQCEADILQFLETLLEEGLIEKA
ncbi:MAG: PqqD family protein [Hyphomicrobium sp.]